MTSILKVDTIQDTAGNNIINESSDTITIGASGDTITIPSGATIDLSSATQTGVGGTNTPIVFVKANTTTSLTNATTTKINLANEIIDTDNLFASNRFTVTSGFEGKYLIIAQYSVNISTDSVGFDLDIQKNGSSYTSAISKTNRGAIDTYSVGCSAIVDLTTNDYIEMFAYQATGGTITVNANDNRVFLGITKLIE
jgi:hypothetical protein